MAEEINKEELFDGVELTPDTNDLPTIEADVVEEAPAIEAPAPTPVKKAQKKAAPKAKRKSAPQESDATLGDLGALASLKAGRSCAARGRGGWFLSRSL